MCPLRCKHATAAATQLTGQQGCVHPVLCMQRLELLAVLMFRTLEGL